LTTIKVAQNRFALILRKRRAMRGSREDTAISPDRHNREIAIPPLRLGGSLHVPAEALGLVVFAHGSGSSRFSPRNLAVATALNAAGFATLLFDLLTPEEEDDRAKVFDIQLLADRLTDAIRWIGEDSVLASLPLGLFGASTGAAAALVAATRFADRLSAVVSRGGRPDLAGAALALVRAPTLLIVGGNDGVVVVLNEQALAKLKAPKALWIVPHATHLFPEPGALETVSQYAVEWFSRYLGRRIARAGPGRGS
jgi:putative phosphoribosyl transferase